MIDVKSVDVWYLARRCDYLPDCGCFPDEVDEHHSRKQ